MSAPVVDEPATRWTRLRMDERCADCAWPDVCERDVTCWKAERSFEMNVPCKIDGCENEANSASGPWARICPEHISEEMQRRSVKRLASMGMEPRNGSPPAEKVTVTAPSPPNGNLAALLRDAAEIADRVHELEVALDLERAALKVALEGIAAA